MRGAVVRTHHLARTATTPPLRDEWANGLTALLQNELRIAARRGVISAGECEQLLARLVLIVDQALSAD